MWIDLTRSVAPLLWLKQICLVKTETETMKAMNTPAAKAKGMKPETKTMKVMKTPAAKAKGMRPKTEPLAGMKIPAAKAKQYILGVFSGSPCSKAAGYQMIIHSQSTDTDLASKATML